MESEALGRAAEDGALSWFFATLMFISGVLAAVSFATNSIPLLLGAMIVAPLYPPLALVVLGLANGQTHLAARGLGTTATGLALAVLAAIATTWGVAFWDMVESDTVLLHRPLLEERVRPGWYSFITAVAAGIAGSAAYLKHKMDALIGTVASLALVPAAAAAGIAWYIGDSLSALGGVVLLAVNVGLIIATGLVVIVVLRLRIRD